MQRQSHTTGSQGTSELASVSTKRHAAWPLRPHACTMPKTEHGRTGSPNHVVIRASRGVVFVNLVSLLGEATDVGCLTRNRDEVLSGLNPDFGLFLVLDILEHAQSDRSPFDGEQSSLLLWPPTCEHSVATIKKDRLPIEETRF